MRAIMLVLCVLALTWLVPASPELHANGGDLEVLAAFGPAVDAVVVKDRHAFVAEGPLVHVLAIADLAHPRRIASLELPGAIRRLALDGERLYAAGAVGLAVIDITNPAAPALIARPITTELRSVAGRDGIVYTHAWTIYSGVVETVDLRDPARPVSLGRLAEQAYDLLLDGEYLYLHGRDQGLDRATLKVFDIRDPARPTQLGQTEGPTVIFGPPFFAGTGAGRVYIADAFGLSGFDVEDPSQPRAVIAYRPGDLNLLESAVVVDDIAYCVEGFKASYPFVLDMRGDGLPRMLWPPTGIPWVVGASGGLLFARIDGVAGYRLLDAANPAVPIPRGAYILPVGTAFDARGASLTTGVARSVFAGSIAYLRTLGMRDPFAPRLERREAIWSRWVGPIEMRDLVLRGEEAAYCTDFYFAFAGREAAIDGCRALALAGTTAFIVGENLDLFGLEDGQQAQLSGATLGLPEDALLLDVAADGDWAYVLGPGPADAITIVDARDRLQPRVAATLAMTDARALALEGSNLYVVGADLTIFDVSTPDQPRLRATLDTPGVAADVAVARGWVYSADDQGLTIVDARDPDNPQLAVTLDLPTGATGVRVAAPRLYARRADGVLVALWHGPAVTLESPDAGGTLTSADGAVELSFVPGSLPGVATVSLRRQRPASPYLQDGQVLLEPIVVVEGENGVEPTAPFSMTVRYDGEGLDAGLEASLALYRWDGAAWVREPSSSVDVAADSVSAAPSEFGRWALFGDAYRILLLQVWR